MNKWDMRIWENIIPHFCMVKGQLSGLYQIADVIFSFVEITMNKFI